VPALVAAAWLVARGLAAAHPFEVTNVDVRLEATTYRVDITFHVDAMLADVPLGDLSDDQTRRLRALPDADLERRLEMVRQYFSAMVGVRFDGRPTAFTVTFPNREPSRDSGRLALPGHLVRLEGAIPADAQLFTFTAAPVFNMIVLRIAGPRGPPVEQLLDPLRESDPYRLSGTTPVPDRLAIVLDYARLGFLHILPRGLDHVLFVLGLYLLSVRLRALIWQVTAFTLAHTLTLALSLYGVVRLPAAVVEPLIALSITAIAVENLFTATLTPWRPVVVFGFGLLHGLGFAAVLAGLGLPRERFVTALVGFNAGVEAGQIAVIALAFAATGWWRRHPRYRSIVVVPASAAIAAVGMYWAVVRTLANW
jgi:hypothetical protein